jgi:[ribosomal protein S5]-alanine N-acetyltransferase
VPIELPRLLGAVPPAFRLTGQRTLLRAPERRDWRPWAELRGESRAFLTPWEPTWSPDALTRGAFNRRLARYATDWRNDQGYSFLLFRLEDDALLGGIGLTNVRRGVAESASLGYWIGEPHARQGYMTDAIETTVAFAFETLQLHRLEAACLPSNAASQGVLRKLAFRQEGYARRYLRINGEWCDHLLYALLAEEAGYQHPSERAFE